MEKLGYGPNHRLNITVSTRDLPAYRDPAVILIDQLKEVYIDGELEPIDTTNYFPRIRRKDFTVGLSLQTSGTQRPSVTNAARELERGGLIARGRRQVTILDRQGLVAASCECYQLVRARAASHLPKTYA
jgi:peptide/nickel transport system substrate-binding protein